MKAATFLFHMQHAMQSKVQIFQNAAALLSPTSVVRVSCDDCCVEAGAVDSNSANVSKGPNIQLSIGAPSASRTDREWPCQTLLMTRGGERGRHIIG